MQRVHIFISWSILLLLALHLLMASVTLLTPVFLLQSPFIYLFFGLVLVHGALALWKVFRHGGGRGGRQIRKYAAENKTYLARIISGLMIAVLAFLHINLWTISTPFGVLPKSFDQISLAIQLLFVLAIAVHVTLNIRPLLIDSGLDLEGRGRKIFRWVVALMILLAVIGPIGYFMGVML